MKYLYTGQELELWLEKAAESEDCALQLAERIEAGTVMEVPPLFSETVWNKIQSTEERKVIPGKKRPEYTPRIMRSYPFKVALAACAAILLMNVGAFEWIDEEARGLFLWCNEMTEGVMGL